MSDIVLATDGSDPSVAAAKYLISANLAGPGNKIHVVHVSAPLTGRAASLVGAQAVEEWHAQEAAEAIEPVMAVLSAAGVAAESHGLVGHAPRELADFANRMNASLLVLGAHGRGALLDAVVGSVATRVVSLAKCPVLLVK